MPRVDFAFRSGRLMLLMLGAMLSQALSGCVADPLPSWNRNPVRAEILDFVDAVTDPGGPGYVPPAERIAVFDNDGTLWAEQPAYAQLYFAIDRVKAMAPQHPEWSQTEPFRSILAGDLKAVLADGEESVLRIVAATHSGRTTDEFEREVMDWIATGRHPATGRLFTEMVYQPMVELLEYLREHGFKTYIVSGGGIEFMRPWVEAVYGIPREQVIGSSVLASFEIRDGVPVLVKLPEIGSLNDKDGKPININLHIGRRPIAAFGNSDGDLRMLQWTAGGQGTRLCVLIHHTDAEREWAYDRDSHVGRLDKALLEARDRGWTVVSMKSDWAEVFPTVGPER